MKNHRHHIPGRYGCFVCIVFCFTTNIFSQVEFTTHIITTDANSAQSVYAVDVNGDGHIDVLSAFWGAIEWYENDGNENFTPHTITTSTIIGQSVYAVDVDDDGDIDVLSASVYDGKIAWYENLSTVGIVNNDLSVVPVKLLLYNNYPNPFNPITTIQYDLPEQSYVTITIYDILGRQIKILFDQTQDAGYKTVIWNATNDYGKPMSAGVYLFQIRSGEFFQTRKMLLLK